MKYTCVVFDKPLNVSWKLFLKTSHFTSLERSFSGLQDSSVLWWQHFFRNMHLFLSFLSFYFLHYLHYHFVCQYKRRNCSQMISGWYLTLSCLSLVCSATFLTLSLYFYIPHALALLMSSLSCLLLMLLLKKKPTICLNHAKRFTSHIKQIAASWRAALASPFSFSHLPT